MDILEKLHPSDGLLDSQKLSKIVGGAPIEVPTIRPGGTVTDNWDASTGDVDEDFEEPDEPTTEEPPI